MSGMIVRDLDIVICLPNIDACGTIIRFAVESVVDNSYISEASAYENKVVCCDFRSMTINAYLAESVNYLLVFLTWNSQKRSDRTILL
jgi:hypothetical protein